MARRHPSALAVVPLWGRMLLLSGRKEEEDDDDDEIVYDFPSSPPRNFSRFIFDFFVGDDCESSH